jgi:hypothetical protein
VRLKTKTGGLAMKKVIEGKVYNTETAEKIYSWDNGFYGGDFKQCEETLYRTKKGRYFLYGEGGPMSRYAKPVGGNAYGYGSNIEVMTDDEAALWLESKNAIAEIEKYFPDYLEEA